MAKLRCERTLIRSYVQKFQILTIQILTQDLHELIKRHMIHGPCGIINPKSPCMADGQCGKHFSKDFRVTTRLGDESYPEYRRRSSADVGHTATIKVQSQSITVDNANVVQYNPWLLMKYRAHINVEYCSSIKAVKYLYKYIFKGSDQATVSFQNNGDQVNVDVTAGDNQDEITKYESCRYIGASEACWRLFEFPIQHRHPAVEAIPVHPPVGRFQPR